MRFTILGSSGFLGSHLKKYFQQQGYDCFTPKRNDPAIYYENLGHVFYCIGVTSDFMAQPFNTIQAHVSQLAELLQKVRFESLLYLSSTRVYLGVDEGCEEAALKVNSLDPNDLYNLSKLMGEAACFATRNPQVRVARISNVIGSNLRGITFFDSIESDAIENKHVVLQTALSSEKDYLAVNDLVQILPRIALFGKRPIYNVASGVNITHASLVEAVQQFTGCTYEIAPGAPEVRYPKISIERLQSEFNFKPTSILEYIHDQNRSRQPSSHR